VVITIALLLYVVALVLLFMAAFGVVHSRVQFLPLGLALALLAFVLRLFPP
jgi:hypothetical protein